MTGEVRRFLRSIGPLDELTIHNCDLRIFFAASLNPQKFGSAGEPFTFPPIKALTILDPMMVMGEKECLEAVVELAREQHRLENPFECVTVRVRGLPDAMEERLKRWAGAVEFYEQAVEIWDRLGDCPVPFKIVSYPMNRSSLNLGPA
jgi:hypothetical protein